ncbi:BrxE family protein [Terrisporobacter glycolicus]|nr:BrxE family protein [Terrisporobacter glycolicus]
MNGIKHKISEIANKIDANKSNIETKTLVDLLYHRLVIMRIGEEDNSGWWESSILSEVGRRNLEKFFPNTFSKQRYNISKKIVTDKEDRIILEKRFITLFNFGYKFESEIFNPFIKEIFRLEEWEDVLKSLEEIREKKYSENWLSEFYENISSEVIDTEMNIIELGSLQHNFYSDRVKFEEAIRQMISVYNVCTPGNAVIPFYKRRMAI